MLDPALFRTDAGGDPDVVRESQRRRGADVGLVSAVIELDGRWRAQLQVIKMTRDAARAEVKAAAGAAKAAAMSKTCADLAAAKATAGRLQRQLAERLEPFEAAERTLRSELHAALAKVSALVHEHAPLRPELLGHGGVGAAASGSGTGSSTRAAEAHEVAQQRLVACGWAEASAHGWRARGPALLAQHAMVSYALAAAARAGYTLLPWPVHAPPSVAKKVQKLRTDRGEEIAAADGSLLPPDEAQGGPIGALHGAAWLLVKELPLRYAYVVDGAADGCGGVGPHVIQYS